MAITLKDVANVVGVDPSVVSRVLNNKDGNYKISEVRKEEIRKAARDLGYVPNISARIIQEGSFGCVALLISSDSGKSYLPSHLLESIHDELEKCDKHLLLTKLPDTNSNEYSKMPKVLQTLMADGLIVDYTHQVSGEIVSQIENHTLPAIWLNVKRDKDSVFPDNRKAGEIATQKLIEAGHRRIAYITELTHFTDNYLAAHFSVKDRYFGYEAGMKKSGLQPLNINNNNKLLPREKQVDYFVEILSQTDRPTALLTYWPSIAFPIIQAARILKLHVPQDLSIITFASCMAESGGLSIDAMIEPEIEMGIEAVKMLNEKIKNPGKLLPSRLIDFSYRKAGSV